MDENKKDECCPKFNPESWDGKVHEWEDKKFIKDKVRTVFYIPLNFGGVIKRMMKKIEEAGAKSEDWMGLSDHTSKWSMDFYLAVDKEVPDAENVAMAGRFLSKVYEGSFKDTKEWCDDFENFAKEKGEKIGKMFMWYTTCPKCAKKYGKNYVVIMSNVK